MVYAHTISAKYLLNYCSEQLVTHFEELRDTPEFDKLPSRVKIRSRDLWQQQVDEQLRQEAIRIEKARQIELKRQEEEAKRLHAIKMEEERIAREKEQNARLLQFLQKQTVQKEVKEAIVEEEKQKPKFVPKPIKDKSDMKDLEAKYTIVNKSKKR